MNHRFLSMAEEAMTAPEAEKFVQSSLRTLGFALADHYVIRGKRIAHSELILEAIATGSCKSLALRESSYFPMTATTSSAISFEATIGAQAFGKVQGPSRSVTAIEEELAGDVLHFRRLAVEASSEHAFEATTRAYRSYLAACVSVVESGLNRLAWLRLKDPAGLTDQHLASLNARSLGIFKKIRTWPAILGAGPLDESAPYWKAFDAIRDARNGYVHVNQPHFGFELSMMADALNLCREGCGTLLLVLRERVGLPAWPAHLQLRHAPLIAFAPRSI